MNEQFEPLEQRLKSLRVVGPSDQVKRQALSAGRAAWHETSGDIPWLIPIRRLGIAAALAMAMVWLADYAGDRTATGWQSVDMVKASKPSPDLGGFDDMTDALLAKHMTCLPRHIDVEAIRQHQEQLRRMLDEQG